MTVLGIRIGLSDDDWMQLEQFRCLCVTWAAFTMYEFDPQTNECWLIEDAQCRIRLRWIKAPIPPASVIRLLRRGDAFHHIDHLIRIRVALYGYA